MAEINYFAVSKALGATIGPIARVPGEPSWYAEATREMSDIVSKRRPHVLALHESGSASRQYVSKVRKAFEAVREGFSPDRVVADPRLNRAFLNHCEAFGIEDEPFNLNWTLLSLRKNKLLPGLHSKRSSLPDQWKYAFASEVAATAMFYRYELTVDRVICHPTHVKEFDHLARSLAPGFSAFEYRWAALNLRKKGASVPEGLRLRFQDIEWAGPLPFSATRRVPGTIGIYTLDEGERTLYVASSENLHESVEAQLRIAEVPLLEPDLWHPNPQKLSWRYSALPDVPSSPRHSLVNDLVDELSPLFNIRRHRAA